MIDNDGKDIKGQLERTKLNVDYLLDCIVMAEDLIKDAAKEIKSSHKEKAPSVSCECKWCKGTFWPMHDSGEDGTTKFRAWESLALGIKNSRATAWVKHGIRETSFTRKPQCCDMIKWGHRDGCPGKGVPIEQE